MNNFHGQNMKEADMNGRVSVTSNPILARDSCIEMRISSIAVQKVHGKYGIYRLQYDAMTFSLIAR
jgi:predicted DNA binding CopG/RHH family protein